jgi:PAS domain S-box-containing protein
MIGILMDSPNKRRQWMRCAGRGKSKLYQALINQSNDSVEVLDPETGNFLKVNNKTCSDLGFSREELLTMKVFDIDPMVKPSDYPTIMENLRRTGGSIWNGYICERMVHFSVEVSLS